MKANDPTIHNPFPIRRILPILLATLLVMFSVSMAIEWYSENVSLPRYCGDPQESLRYLEADLRDQRPAGDEPRKPYLIAAKLLFLVPRGSGESIDAYLDRVELEILRHCR